MRSLKVTIVAIPVATLVVLLIFYVSNYDAELKHPIPTSTRTDDISTRPGVQQARPDVADENPDGTESNSGLTELSNAVPDLRTRAPNSSSTIDDQVNQDNFNPEMPTTSNPSPQDSHVANGTSGADEAERLVPRFWTLGSATLSSSVGDFIQFASNFQHVWHGSASVLIRAKQPIDRTATAGVVQVASAVSFRDTRVRFSGFLQVASIDRNVPASAMIWIRADDPSGRVVAFQNTLGRHRFESGNWHAASIVIDIPIEAYTLHYGASLVGNGSVWIDLLSFEEVSEEIPLTSRPFSVVIFNRVPAPGEILQSPTNLDFEENHSAP